MRQYEILGVNLGHNLEKSKEELETLVEMVGNILALTRGTEVLSFEVVEIDGYLNISL